MRKYVALIAKLLFGTAIGLAGGFMMFGARKLMGDAGWHLFVPGLLCGLVCVSIWVHVWHDAMGGR